VFITFSGCEQTSVRVLRYRHRFREQRQPPRQHRRGDMFLRHGQLAPRPALPNLVEQLANVCCDIGPRGAARAFSKEQRHHSMHVRGADQRSHPLAPPVGTVLLRCLHSEALDFVDLKATVAAGCLDAAQQTGVTPTFDGRHTHAKPPGRGRRCQQPLVWVGHGGDDLVE
jgi:hypothetical protein